jgi:hypothetical protein
VNRVQGVAAGLTIAFVSSFCVSLPTFISHPRFEVRAAYAQDDWKKEFEEICARTDDAMSFGREELKGLISRCDKLKPAIEALDESARKVYLRRLQLCRDLLAFVLESKEKN